MLSLRSLAARFAQFNTESEESREQKFTQAVYIHADDDDDDDDDDDEEEEVPIVDPKQVLEEECHHHCVHEFNMYDDCVKRIKYGTADEDRHCEPWLFDIRHCLDHCAAPVLFSRLK